jgi:hypothetical protein
MFQQTLVNTLESGMIGAAMDEFWMFVLEKLKGELDPEEYKAIMDNVYVRFKQEHKDYISNPTFK